MTDDRAIRKLNDSVETLSGDARDVRADLNTQTEALWARTRVLWVAIGVSAAVLMAVIGIAVSVSLSNEAAIERNNARFCTYVAINAAKFPKPSTLRGIALQDAAAKLLDDLKCPK